MIKSPNKPVTATNVSKRLVSLDVMRGAIMILLAAESCLVYEALNNFHFSGIGGELVKQFFHHPWHGLHFWDLVQPAFMYIAGVAMYISYYYKKQKGISWKQNFKHIAIRCFKLFLFGTALHCVYAGKLVWELWNVLTQLSVTTIVAYIIINRSNSFQIIVSIFLLIITEILYRTILVTGFNQPFVEYYNFGAWFDTVLGQKINTDGWVAINVIPTSVHTIFGVMTGRLLIKDISYNKKISILVTAGIICLTIGFGLDMFHVTPIIKRIGTSSFVLTSAGFVILILAFLYWLVDVKKINKYAWVFIVVGMNSIFIYLFFETLGSQWLNGTVAIFAKGFLNFISIPVNMQNFLSAVITLFAEWYMCYWLYKKKIFIKI